MLDGSAPRKDGSEILRARVGSRVWIGNHLKIKLVDMVLWTERGLRRRIQPGQLPGAGRVVGDIDSGPLKIYRYSPLLTPRVCQRVGEPIPSRGPCRFPQRIRRVTIAGETCEIDKQNFSLVEPYSQRLSLLVRFDDQVWKLLMRGAAGIGLTEIARILDGDASDDLEPVDDVALTNHAFRQQIKTNA